MAKLSTQLSEPTPVSRGTSPSSPDTTVGDVLRVAESGLNVFSQVKAKQKQEEQQQSLSGIQTSILDLEDERNALALEDQQLSAQVQEIVQDGVTEDEQATLNALEKDRARLTKARRRGVLNPLNFQTRMNALQKQALADVTNLAIQPQINQLFSQGRSRITAPIPTAQKQFEADMDNKYGVGNWSGVDAGRERGKAIYLNQLRADAHNNFNTLRGKEALGFMNIADDAVRATRNSLTEKGALQDTDVDLYRSRINAGAQQMMISIDEAVQANRAAGLPIDQDTVKQAKQRVLDTQKFYLDFMAKGQEFGDNVMLSQRLANMNSIVDNLNKARNPQLGQIAAAIAGTGSNGDVAALAQIVSMDDSMLQGVISALPEQLRANMDVNSLRSQAAQAVAFAIDGIDFKEAANGGLINPRLAATVGGVIFKNSDNETSIDSGMSAFENVNFNDTEGSLDLFNDSKTKNNLKANPKGMKRMPAVATHLWDNIVSNMRPSEFENLSIDEKGNIMLDMSKFEGIVDRGHAMYFNKLFKKFTEFHNNYSSEIKMSKEEFLKEVLPQEEEVREEGSE